MTEVIYGILREKRGKLTERKATGIVKERERKRWKRNIGREEKGGKKVRMCEMRKEDSPHLSFPTSFSPSFPSCSGSLAEKCEKLVGMKKWYKEAMVRMREKEEREGEERLVESSSC